jgi:hypothetical protein
MRKLISSVAAFLIGLVSFVLTVALVLLIQKVTDFNFFTLMWWAVVPLGAFVTGVLAASGFYFGMLKLNVRPTKTTAVIMLAVAAMVQVALYYTQYAMAVGEDGRSAREFIGYLPYVNWSLTHAQYGLTLHGSQVGSSLEVGVFGYVIAFLQFLALVSGGGIVFVLLADKPYCDDCGKFLKKINQFQLPFGGDAVAVEELRRTEVQIGRYFERLLQLPPGADKMLELEVSGCPSCHKEHLVERLMFAKDGKYSYHILEYPNRNAWFQPGDSITQKITTIQGQRAGH